MFTGIIQAVGNVARWQDGVLAINPNGLDLLDVSLGESIAVNGVCLTVVKYENALLEFDLSPETVNKSTFKDIQVGSAVNLERAMALGDRLGGHIVQGHVDGQGVFLNRQDVDNSSIFRFRVTNPKYIIEKGSITINGISLTVVNPTDFEFEVWVIPHTLENTNLSALTPGSAVNIEYDVIAKYVERISNYS